MTVFGWDASDFDADRGPVDLGAATRDGIAFFTHKATEGTRVTHSQFGPAMARAVAAGIRYLGAYCVPRTPGNGGHGTVEQQTDYLIAYVETMAPWWSRFEGWFWQVDLERWSNAAGVVYDDVAPSIGVRMCQLLRERTGRRVVLYAPRWRYADTILGSDPLWASDYGANAAGPYRSLYPGDGSPRWNAYSGRTPMILQYSSRAVIGSQSTCDANAFRGSIADFHRFITGKDLDVALKDDPDGKWMYPRIEAVLSLAPPSSGPEQGKDLPFLKWAREVTAALAELRNRPSSLVLTDAQVAQLAAAIVARPDNPLGQGDLPAIKLAVKQAMAEIIASGAGT